MAFLLFLLSFRCSIAIIARDTTLTTTTESNDGVVASSNPVSTIVDRNGYHVTVSTQSAYDLRLSLDSSWGFLPTSQSTISITLNGHTPDPSADADLLIVFSVADSQYLSFFIHLDDGKMASKIYHDLSLSANDSTVSEWIADTDSFPDRWDRISNGNQWETISEWKAQSLWPLQFDLINDPINDRAHFEFRHNASSVVVVDYLLFDHFATNQPLDVFILGDSINEQFTVSSFQISMHEDHQSTAMTASTTSSNAEIVNTANPDSMDKDPIRPLTASTATLLPHPTNLVTQSTKTLPSSTVIVEAADGVIDSEHGLHPELSGLIYGGLALILIIAASVLLLILCFWSGAWLRFKPQHHDHGRNSNVRSKQRKQRKQRKHRKQREIPADLTLSAESNSNSRDLREDSQDTIDSAQSSDLSVMYNPTYPDTPNPLLLSMALNGSPDSKLFPVGAMERDSDCELIIDDVSRDRRDWRDRSAEAINVYALSYDSRSGEFVVDASATSVDGCFGSKFESDDVMEGVDGTETAPPLRYIVEEEQPGDGNEMENDGVLLLGDDFVVPTSRGPSMCQ